VALECIDGDDIARKLGVFDEIIEGTSDSDNKGNTAVGLRLGKAKINELEFTVGYSEEENVVFKLEVIVGMDDESLDIMEGISEEISGATDGFEDETSDESRLVISVYSILGLIEGDKEGNFV
jgi:hypothetical protein